MVALNVLDLPSGTHQAFVGKVTRTTLTIGPKNVLLPSRTRSVAVPGDTGFRIKFVVLATVTEATVFGVPAATLVTVSNVSEDRKLLGATVMATDALVPSQKGTRFVKNVTFTTCSVAVSLQLDMASAEAVMV